MPAALWILGSSVLSFFGGYFTSGGSGLFKWLLIALGAMFIYQKVVG